MEAVEACESFGKVGQSIQGTFVGRINVVCICFLKEMVYGYKRDLFLAWMPLLQSVKELL